jgi:hypothetical protein
MQSSALRCRWIGYVLILVLSAATSPADVVTLKGGGSVHGKVMTSSSSRVRTVTVKTSAGALIVFDRAAVEQIKHGPNALPKTSANSSPSKTASAKPRFTAAQEAWMPKIRSPFTRLFDQDRDKSRRARSELLKIDDPDAIPALLRYLGRNLNVDARRLFITIVRHIPGPLAVYLLVERSIFDPSSEVRDEARKGISEEQADAARTLYIEALKTREPNIASRAAIGIAEIGDPRREAVPYLIDTLTFDSKTRVMIESAQWGTLYTEDIYAKPGVNVPALVPGAIFVGQELMTSTVPVAVSPSGVGAANSNNVLVSAPRNPNQTVTLTTPSPFGGPAAMGLFYPNSIKAQLGGPGTYMITPTIADHYVLPVKGFVAPPRYAKVPSTHENPAVLDTLVKVTDQKYPGYAYQADRWRRWWDNEKKNSDLPRSSTAASEVKRPPSTP